MSNENLAIPKMLTVEQMAKALGVSATWIYRHAANLAPVRVGRLLRFSESQTLRLLSPSVAPKYATPIERNCLTPERTHVLGFREYQEGSVYREGNSWMARWRERVCKGDGTTKRVQRHRKIGTISELPTKTDARRRLMDILRNTQPRADITFGQLADRWKELVVPTLEKPSANFYTRTLEKHVRAPFEHVQISAITGITIQTFLAEKSREGYSTNYLKAMKITASKVFSWAVRCGWLKENPCSQIAVPKSGIKRKRFVLTQQQVMTLIGELPRREAVMVVLLAITGLRISEAVALRWSDFEDGFIQVRRYVYEAQVNELEAGESAHRSIPIPASLRAMMEILRETENDDWIFRSRTGLPMNHQMSLKRKVKPALRKLKLPDIGWHDFRHTLITWMGKAKFSPQLTAGLVGHSDVETTLRIYTHIASASPETVNALDEIAAKLFRNVPGRESKADENIKK
jgi:integrase